MSLTRTARAGISLGLVTLMSFATGLPANAAPTASGTPPAPVTSSSPASTSTPTPSTATRTPAAAPASSAPAITTTRPAATAAASASGDTPVTGVSIAQLGAPTQPSGSTWSYRLKYTCTLNTGNVCGTGGIITIPLGAAAKFSLTLATSPAVKSYSVDANGNLVIKMNDLGNESGQIGINMVAPNVTTPNGTTWTLDPTLTFPDGSAPTATAPAPATSTATASPSFSSLAKRSASTFYRDGQTVTYTLAGGCSYDQQGVAQTKSLVLTDSLPAGLTYVSATGAASTSVNGQVITLNLSPSNCATTDQVGGSFSVTLTATVNANTPNGALDNTVQGVETTVDGQTTTRTADASITVYDSSTPPGGHIDKYGYGSLRNTQGDAQASIPGTSVFSSATEPGTGYESSYGIDVDAPATGMTSRVVDAMPCMTNSDGTTYSSLSSGTCTAPAWNPKSITIFSPTGSIDTSNYHPVITLTDGSTVSLNSPFTIPSQDIGKVAAISFPRSAALAGNLTFNLSGYVTDGIASGSVIANTATGTIYPDTTSTTGLDTTDTGHLYIVDRTEIGILKSASVASTYAPGNFQWGIEGFVNTSGPLTGDVVMEDTLPAGIQPPDPSNVDNPNNPVYSYIEFTDGSTPSVEYFPTMTTFANPDGTTKVLFTYPASVINKYLSDGGRSIVLMLNWTSSGVPAGSYTNNAAIFLDQVGVDVTQCVYGDVTKADPDNLDNNSNTAFHCASAATVKVIPTAGANSMALTKSVKGSEDADFRTYPASGSVPDSGGAATFRLTWTNRSAGDLDKVVLYDLLPRVGDTGTIAGTAKRSRHSQFTPSLSSIPTPPAGFSVYYSQATNPCRPEVYPNANNAGCTDDWTSTAPADLSSVKALKLVEIDGDSVPSLGTVVFDYDVTTPAIDRNLAAWNTFAASAHDASDGDTVPPAESNRVGISRKDFSHITFGKSIASITDPQGSPVDPTKAAAGDTVTYTLTATDDGAVNATGVVLVDTLPDGLTATSQASASKQVTINAGTLTPGQIYTATVKAVIGGSVSDTTLVNRLAVTTTSSTPTEPTSDTVCADDESASCASLVVPPAPLMVLHKSVDKTTANPGDTLTYTFTVDNPGTAEGHITGLYDVLPANVTYVSSNPAGDAGGGQLLGLTLDNPITVPVGAKNQVVATVVVTVNQGEYDTTVTNGGIAFSDTGFVTGDQTCPDGYAASTIGSGTYQVYMSCAKTTTNKAAAAIKLVKTASAPPNGVGYTVGQKVTYTFTATNAGNTTLSNVALSEGTFTNGAGASDQLDAPPVQSSPANWDATLAPEASATWTGTHTVTAADVAAGGQLTNTASVSAQPQANSDGTQPPTVTATASARATIAHPGVSLVKSATGPSANKVGGVITYEFTVTNTGNVPLTGVALAEKSFVDAHGNPLTLDAAPKPVSPANFDPATSVLAPGAVVVYRATHTLTQRDLDTAGTVTNQASVTATPSDGEATVGSSSTASATITPHGPAITLVKTASKHATGAGFEPGQVVTYTFVATNSGDVTLSNVTLAETSFRTAAGRNLVLTSGPTRARNWTASLAPGRSDVWTATYKVTMPDVVTDASITNKATVSATSSSGTKVSASASATIQTTKPCDSCHATTRTITYQVQVDDWRLRTGTQVATAARVVKDFRYGFREDVAWNTRTGRVSSAPLWPVSTNKVVTMKVTVPVKATPAQVLAAEKAAAARAFGVTDGAHPAPRVGHTYHSVWIIPPGGWTNQTPWGVGMKTLPQIEVGASMA